MTDILELANVCAAAGGCGPHCPGFDDNTKCFDTSVSHLSPHEIAGHIVAGEQLRAKHAALMEAAKAVRNHVGVLYDHPLGWKCSICGGVAGDGHFSSCEWYRFVTAIADLEASDD